MALFHKKCCDHTNLQTITNIHGDAINYYQGRSIRACIDCGKQIIIDELDINCKRHNEFNLNKHILYAKSIDDISDGYHTFDYIYVTALGYYESEGMGSYKDMDALNIGSVFEKEIEDILVEYGGPIFKTIPIQKKLSLNNK